MRIKLKPNPVLGDAREVTKFAFLPTRLDDDNLVWLEFYKETQLYTYWVDGFGKQSLEWGKWRTCIINK